ncbi:dynamin-like isoform X2 [Aphidius gifuensis]|uniref:dynamin-like isoform X2 n=1 Tax=Aphidius gifuensis TaxID=684658 RepID=UPI001CDD377C|nr:dynamin-like isoform X2 [Aphidius gifuensis]
MAGISGMDSLVSIVNRLQDVTTRSRVTFEWDSPQIALVGGRSVGKSSLIESLVGRDFLPRGYGMVTRRPLILQLINNGNEDPDYAEFLHCSDKKFTDFNHVKQEIEEDTNLVIDRKEDISHNPINLRIYSSKVLNSTWIDLPGFTKVPIDDPRYEIESKIHKIILDYISNESCVILAVTPANMDLANSVALQIAKEVDPQGLRTIGVITKLDQLDEKTDVREIFENRLLPLRRGYIGVVNRGSKAIDENTDIADALHDEKSFFKNHESYKHMADKLGTPYLQKILNQQLVVNIRESLPSLRKKLLDQKTLYEKDLSMEDMNIDDLASKTTLMIQMIDKLRLQFANTIGCYESHEIGEFLNGGSKICHLMHEKLSEEISALTSAGNNTVRREIKLAILNIRDTAFEAVAKEQIRRLKKPALDCVSEVTEELNQLLHDCTKVMSRYPSFQEITEEKLITYLKQCEEKCKKQLCDLVEFELSYINTKHVDFIGLEKATEKSYKNTLSMKFPNDDADLYEKFSTNTKMTQEVYKFKILIDSYMDIVTKTVQDLVPKIIMFMIIENVKHFINVELLSQLVGSEDVIQLMELCEAEKIKRDHLTQMYEASNDALKILSQVSASLAAYN